MNVAYNIETFFPEINDITDNIVKLRVKKIPNGVPQTTYSFKSLDDINKVRSFYISNGRLRDDAMLVIGICTGLRISDICLLNVSDIFNEDMSFKEYIDIIELKTGKKSTNPDDRCLITEAMREPILKYMQNSRHKSMNDPLLYSRKKDSNGEHRLKPESGWRIIKEGQRGAGLDYNIGSHSMRKTFANIAACVGDTSGLDMNKLTQVQHMLKHSDYKTTMRYLNLNRFYTQKARTDVSDFVLGKTEYNIISDALISKEDSDVKIMELLNKIYDALEVE